MPISFQTIDAAAARSAFPFIVGPVFGAEVHSPGRAIVRQGYGAWAVVADGNYIACCPNRDYAVTRLVELLGNYQVKM